jgi:hypothetical protein
MRASSMPQSQPPKMESKEDDDDIYEDDFEDYNSDEDENISRLTLKASDNELSEVVDLYK